MTPWKVAALAALSCLALSAEHNEQFVGWMKSTASASNALKKLEKKTGPEAVRSAERIGSAYEEMIGYWRQRNAKDAIKWSQDGKSAATQLAAAAHAGDEEKAVAAFNSLNTTCRPCHDTYREKLPDGKYIIRDSPKRAAE